MQPRGVGYLRVYLLALKVEVPAGDNLVTGNGIGERG
jgi:hypothetical protein